MQSQMKENKKDKNYYKTLSKFGVTYTKKSKEIKEAFRRLENRDAPSISFKKYLKMLSKS
jgi:hypothetical protein